MEALSNTKWDVIISGTGLQQSLLALALSRSEKKVLHVDENEYYGASDAAFSLQDAEEWVKSLENDAADTRSQFSKAHIWRADEGENGSKLSFSRAYTLTLSPQIIYTRSKVLSQLVSSRVYKQLEFQAVGSWWIYQTTETPGTASTNGRTCFRRLPNGREDIFSDISIDVRTKRGLVKFLKFVVDYESHTELWAPYANLPLHEFLAVEFKLESSLQTWIMALTLTLNTPVNTTVQYSLPRIARHLTSIGLLGPGFGAVMPKWGGGSEVAQVACRAGAVGGAVYILGNGVRSTTSVGGDSVSVTLTNGDTLTAKVVVQPQQRLTDPSVTNLTLAKAITVVDSDLNHLFTTSLEGAPNASIIVVTFPSGSLALNDIMTDEPIYIMVHSSETGECPVGQSILYATTSATNRAQERLSLAIRSILISTSSQAPAKALYQVSYHQTFTVSDARDVGNVYSLPNSSPDLAFDDELLEHVEAGWRRVMRFGEDPSDLLPSYMTFRERQGGEGDNEDL